MTVVELQFVWDDPSSGFAYNVYLDPQTGTVYKVDVWDNPGVTEIRLNGEVIVHKDKGLKDLGLNSF